MSNEIISEETIRRAHRETLGETIDRETVEDARGELSADLRTLRFDLGVFVIKRMIRAQANAGIGEDAQAVESLFGLITMTREIERVLNELIGARK